MSEMKVRRRTHSLFLIMEEPEGTKGKDQGDSKKGMNEQTNEPQTLPHKFLFLWGDVRFYEFQKLI